MRSFISSSSVLVIVVVAGCGTDAGDDTATVEEEVNEDACGTAIEDVTLPSIPSTNYYDENTTSPDGNYGTGGTHPACPNQFIVDGHVEMARLSGGVPNEPDNFYAFYEGPLLRPSDFGSCSAEWVSATLWRWSGGRYHRIGTKTAYGTAGSTWCNEPVVSFRISDPTQETGDFRLVAQSGVIYAYMPVYVDFGNCCDW